MKATKQGIYVWVYLLLIPFFTYSDAFVSYNTGLYVLTALLLLFCLLAWQKIYTTEPAFFWINPFVIGTIMTFLLAAGGLTNWYRIGEDGLCMPSEIAPVLSTERSWYNLAMGNTCYAAFFTWLGYRSGVGTDLLRFLNIFWGRLVKSDISLQKLIFFTVFAYIAKWYLFSVGLYGRVVSSEYFEAISGYKAGSQIRILANLSLLTFTIICINFFRTKTPLFRRLFVVSLILEIFFAFIYGARGPFLIPFFIVFVTNYYVNRKFRLNYIFLLTIPVILAFTIVMDFKNYASSAAFNRSSSPIETITTFFSYRSTLSDAKKSENSDELTKNLFGSSNALSEAAMAIRYKDVYGLDNEDPSAFQSMISAPYNAYVPKFLQAQNEFPWGFWFKEKVLQHGIGIQYSITVSPVGFLYLAGGTLMVCLGFFIYGFLLRLNYNLLFHNDMHFILFIMVLAEISNYDSIVASTLVNMLRVLTIYPFIIYILFAKTTRLSFK